MYVFDDSEKIYYELLYQTSNSNCTLHRRKPILREYGKRRNSLYPVPQASQ